MITKKDIIAMARKITKRKGGSKPMRIMNPTREWMIGVGLFLLITLVGGVITAQQYVYYSNLESTVTDTQRPIHTYNVTQAQLVRTHYEARLAQFNAIAGTAERFEVVTELPNAVVVDPADGTATSTPIDIVE